MIRFSTSSFSAHTVTGLTNGTAYTFTVTATNTAGTGPASAASKPVTPKASQTITFANPGAQHFGTSPTFTATATSGLAIAFSSTTTGVCTITSAGALSFVTTGTCTIDANQPGNAAYTAAPTVSQTFTVVPATPSAPTITDLPAAVVYGDGFAATVGTNGDGTTSVASSTPTVCAVGSTGLTVSYVGVGTCTLTAAVAAGTDYTAATGTAQSFAVSKAPTTVSWSAPGPIAYGTSLGNAQLDATASVPGKFTYTPAAGTVLTPGNHALKVDFTPTSTADYTASSTTVTVRVNPVQGPWILTDHGTVNNWLSCSFRG